ncbi:hypothetical protein ATHL_02610 [Anaerolinea thermolimosa]|uniref:hypothetical protein n=1 Tax=Anaerolinea thermolimosa TaxID=229919 RepID=UPI000784ED8B|nr:hypothetical protein [Anaerolinea thermolimosa]GAP07723.1 hypothetical protein ATHL_02610 [Anaerolinea thermolimosa]
MDNPPEREIQQIIRKTQREWYADGIWEIGFGVAILLIALFYWVSEWLNLELHLGMGLPVVQLFFFMAAFLCTRWFIAMLKERVAFPRTGYVVFRRPQPHLWWRRIALGLGVGMAIGGLQVIFAGEGSKSVAWVGLVFALVMVFLSLRFGVGRFFVVGLVTFGLGMGAALFIPDAWRGMTALFTAFGALNLISGLVTMFLFIRRYPVALEGQEEGE